VITVMATVLPQDGDRISN